ncbi:MAG: ribulose-phosphate 3-epimerase [Endomicrobium sp.]|jgi:ribulose-phosphate 3-epimerase|nr:ribulose-phosphate 3-epimerase [Endomicrobium sp.]
MKKRNIIAISILSANFAVLGNYIKMLEEINFGCWIHFDIMDGHFVPNIALGSSVVKSLRKFTKLFFDIHLMVTNPEKYWKDFQRAGADLITFHSEIKYDKKKLIKNIKLSRTKVGISINPETSISTIEKFLPYIDIILIMSVNPGFSGQNFMKSIISKIENIKKIIDKNKYHCLIEIDGGIDFQTAKICTSAGADVLVSGNYVFSSKNFIEAIKSISL